jgi:hypothetical protein
MKRTALIATLTIVALGAAATAAAPSARPTLDSTLTLSGKPTSVLCRGIGTPSLTVLGTYQGRISSGQAELNGKATIVLTARLNELTGIGSGHGRFALAAPDGKSQLRGTVAGDVHAGLDGQLLTMRGEIIGHQPDGSPLSTSFRASFIPSAPKQNQRSSPLPLSGRVIRHGELPGFGPFGPGHTTLYQNAQKWVRLDTSLTTHQASARISRLRREGFKAVLSEQLGSLTRDWGGASWVMQLDSAASAHTELAANVHDWQSTSKPPNTTYAGFAITTIPGAHGYHLGGTAGSFEGDNIEFADGPFLYLVGNGWKTGIANTPPRANLIAAATKLYKRVHGHAAT